MSIICEVLQELSKVYQLLLGGALASIAGIATQVFQNHALIKRKDKELLLEALEILIGLEPILDDLPKSRSELSWPCNRILSIAIRIQTKKYRGLALKLIEFSLKDAKHTKEELNNLLDEIRPKISKPFSIFNKKQNEFFKKVAEELKQHR